MRVLLDEMVSRKLSRTLIGHEVSTVQREGWSGLTNGHLLDAIGGTFDVFLTMDRGMRYQQRLEGRPFGVIELRARSNDIDDVITLAPYLASTRRDPTGRDCEHRRYKLPSNVNSLLILIDQLLDSLRSATVLGLVSQHY